ncbi:MAG: oxidoreductase, partial [Planctomycetaceae bacterium]
WRSWAYRFALERGELDQGLFNWFVNPLRNLFLACDRHEQRLLQGNLPSLSVETEPWRRVLEETP